jgi:hypothetical protein
MALTQVSKDVLNSSQANITQVGTLSNLTVTNTIVGSVSGNANNASFLGGTPAASYALGSAVTTANTAMKGYVDNINSTLTANAAAQSGQIASKADLSGATFTGNVTGTNLISSFGLWGTIRTAAQTNITSVGTLVSLAVTGNVTAGNVSATNLSGAITSAQVTTALGYTPYNATNPSGYTTNTGTVTSVSGTGTVSGLTLTGTVTTSGSLTLGGTLSLTSGQVTGALGFTPYNSTNPSGYISAVPNASTQVTSLGVGTAASGTTGEIRATNNITAYYSSDARLKENVRDIPNALDKVTAIGGKLFAWTDDYIASHGGEDAYFLPKESFGVIAQDVEQVFPEAVRTRDDGYLAVDYEKMCALAFQAIKELQQQVQLLEQQIKDK